MAKRPVVPVETVTYNGHVYRRYPEGPRRSDRVYYHRMETVDGKRTRRYLHIDMWEDAHGPVPPGYHVHHKDSYDDLSLENLECKPGRKHISDHMKQLPMTPEREAHLERIRPMTVAWHQSEEGREWHRQHGHEAAAHHQRLPKTCAHCGSTFDSWGRTSDRFCSNNCKSAWRRDAGLDDVQRACAVCGTLFTVNKYSQKKYCSPACASSREHKTCEWCGTPFRSSHSTARFCSSICKQRERYARKKANG